MIASSVAALVILLAIAVVTAFFTRRLPIPYVVTLALVGVAAGVFVVRGGPIHLSHELIRIILLPGLLFEGAFNLRWSHLRDNLAAVVALATLGVFITTGWPGCSSTTPLALALRRRSSSAPSSRRQTRSP